MYSPKIRESLIPRMYRIAKSAGMPMTRWVNQVIEKALQEESEGQETNERDSKSKPLKGGNSK